MDSSGDRKKKLLASDGGYVLVVALLVMVVLTIMGAAALGIRNSEQAIATNSEIFQTNFYAVEAVTLEGANLIEVLDDSDLLDSTSVDYPTWLTPYEDTDLVTAATAFRSEIDDPLLNLEDYECALDDDVACYLRDAGHWETSNAADLDFQQTTLNNGTNSILPEGYDYDGTASKDRIVFSGIDLGLCGNASLTDPDRLETCYDIYGMYDVNTGNGKAYSGKMMLMIGYKRVLYRP